MSQSVIADSSSMTDESRHQMVDYLENILERQLERLRTYDIDGSLDLADEANSIAEAIGNDQLLKSPAYKKSRSRIEGLYKDLGLTIAAERSEVKDKLKQIRKGLKTLGAYGGKR